MIEFNRLSKSYNKDYTTTVLINLLSKNPKALLSKVKVSNCNYWKIVFPNGKVKKLETISSKKIKNAFWKSFKHYIKIKMAVLPIFSNYKKVFKSSLNKILFALIEKEPLNHKINKSKKDSANKDPVNIASFEELKELSYEEVQQKTLKEKEILINDLKFKGDSLKDSLRQIIEIEDHIVDLEEQIIDAEEDISKLETDVSRSKTFTHQSKGITVPLYKNITELEEFELIYTEKNELVIYIVEKENLLTKLKKSKKEKKLKLKEILTLSNQETIEKLKSNLKLEIDDIDNKLKVLIGNFPKKPSFFIDENDSEKESFEPISEESLYEDSDKLHQQELLVENLECQIVDTSKLDDSSTTLSSLSSSSNEILIKQEIFFEYLKHNLDKIVIKFSQKDYLNTDPKILKKVLENMIVSFDKIKHLFPSNKSFYDIRHLSGLKDSIEHYNIIEKLISSFQSLSLVDFANMDQYTLKGLVFGTIEATSDFEDAFLTHYSTFKKNILNKCTQILIGKEKPFSTIPSIVLIPFKSNYISKLFLNNSLNSFLKKAIPLYIKSNNPSSKLSKNINQAINSYIKSLTQIVEFLIDYVFDKHTNILSYLKYNDLYNGFCSAIIKQKKLINRNSCSLNDALNQIDNKINELLFMVFSDLQNEFNLSLKNQPFERKVIETITILLKNYVKSEENDFSEDDDQIFFTLDDPTASFSNQFLWPFLMKILT